MQNTCNPFTVTAAQVPEDTYIITENVDGIVEKYIKVEEQKNLFNDAKVGDVITFNPKKAYPENDINLFSISFFFLS